MNELVNSARQRKRKSKPAFKIPAPIWRAELPINKCETLRAEITTGTGKVIIHIRRWYHSTDGDPQPTRKGFSCAAKHLPAIAGLINDALTHARAAGLLSESQASRRDDGVDGTIQ
jgi:hypothetical protein